MTIVQFYSNFSLKQHYRDLFPLLAYSVTTTIQTATRYFFPGTYVAKLEIHNTSTC